MKRANEIGVSLLMTSAAMESWDGGRDEGKRCERRVKKQWRREDRYFNSSTISIDEVKINLSGDMNECIVI